MSRACRLDLDSQAAVGRNVMRAQAAGFFKPSILILYGHEPFAGIRSRPRTPGTSAIALHAVYIQRY
jgi:hypothetical protein